MTRSNEKLAEEFLKKKREQEDLHEAALKPSFKLFKITEAGEVNITGSHILGIRRAIQEYQEAAEMMLEK